MEPETALLDPPGSRWRTGEFGQELATPVGALVLRAALFVAPQDTVAEAARAMRQAGTSSALVAADPLGILTSGDLRNRVLAEQLPAGTPVAEVMTRPVSTLPEDAPLYRALLLMLDQGFEHVPVTRDGQVTGVITHMDMLRHQARSPMLLLSRIRSLHATPALDRYAEALAETAQALLADGLQPARIARVVAGLNDALSGRLLQLAQDQLGPPPCPFAWLALGSEGRREQILPTDQDSALAYQDDTPEAAGYFGALAKIVVDGLLTAGFAPCDGGFMAVNWCRPLASMARTFRNWVEEPGPQAMVEASVFLDFRRVHGGLSVDPLQQILLDARHKPLFLAGLARSAGSFEPPLGLFGRVRTQDGLLDLKHSALVAIVIMGRIFALEAGSAARGTVARLEAAAAHSVISTRRADELADTFSFLIRLRLREQLRQREAGHTPDNRIRVQDLTGLEQRRLRDGFKTVIQMQRTTTTRLRGE